MKHSILTVLLAGVVASCLCTSANAQEKKASREQLDERIDTVNEATRKPEMMKVALERISNQTGVPVEQVQALHKRHDEVRAGGLLVACVLAAETKKAPDTFLKQRNQGKSWSAIARENNVPADKLIQRLDNLRNALGNEPRKKD